MSTPSLGEDGLISESQSLSSVLKCLPIEVGALKKHTVVHSCLHTTEQYLAIGSEQGYVWVVDLSTNQLLREFSDLKGSVVTAVRMNDVRDHIAYGTTQGILRVEAVTRPMAKRYTIRERDDQPLSALAWSQDGYHLYSGYTSGRLIKFRFQFTSGVMEAFPLLECGSQVIQLSLWGEYLLISTLARSLMLETDTGRLTQVGTKERRPGVFGGSYAFVGSRAYLVRPGLRIWTADEKGKVLQTAKFREVFMKLKHLPRIAVHSWPVTTPTFSDAWQFSLLHVWMDRYIVTLRDKMLWVLVPERLAVVGVLSLEHKITAVSPHGNELFILCGGVATPLIRLTFDPRFTNTSVLNPEAMAILLSDQAARDKEGESGSGVKVDGELPGSEPGLLLPIDQGQQETSEKESVQMAVEEDLDKELGTCGEQLISGEGGLEINENESRQKSENDEHSGDEAPVSYDDKLQSGNIPFTEPNPHKVKPGSGTTTPTELHIGNIRVELKDVKEMLKPTLGRLSDLIHQHQTKRKREEVDSPGEKIEFSQWESGEHGTEGREGKKLPSEPTSETITPVDQRESSGISELKDVLRLGSKLGSLQRGAMLGGGGEREVSPLSLPPRPPDLPLPGSPSTNVTRSLPLDSQEQARRLRMSQAKEGEDDVVVSHRHSGHRKRRKKRSKKMSSRSSSASTSLERLNEITEEANTGPTEAPPMTTPTTTPNHVVRTGDVAVTVEQPSEVTASDAGEGRKPVEERRTDPTGPSSSPSQADVPITSELDQQPDRRPGTAVTAISTAITPSEEVAPTSGETHQNTPSKRERTVSSPTEQPPSLKQGASPVSLQQERPRSQSEVSPPELKKIQPSHKKAPSRLEMAPQRPLFDNDEDVEFEFLDHTPTPTLNSKFESLVALKKPHGQLSLRLIDDTPLQSPSDVTLVDMQQQSHGERILDVVAKETSLTPRPPLLVTGEWDQKGSDSENLSFADSVDDPLYYHELSEGTKQRKREQQKRGRRVRIVDPLSDSSGGSLKFGRSLPNRISPLSTTEHTTSTSDEPSGGMSSDSARLDMSGSGTWPTATDKHPLDSDSSHDEDGECPLVDSLVSPDYYKLCGTLVEDSNVQVHQKSIESSDTMRRHRRDFESGLPVHKGIPEFNCDIWVPIPYPSRYTLQSICLSDQALWLVDSRGSVFYTTVESKGKDWQRMKRAFDQIASSSSGKIVWGVYRQNAYVRLGMGSSLASSIWRNVTRPTLLAKFIKQVAVDKNAVWAVKTDGQVLFRKGVSESNPEGKVWQEVGHAAGFTYVACNSDIVWVLTESGKVFIREGITASCPSGNRWTEVKAPMLSEVSIASSGVVWGISQQESSLGFRCGVTRGKPMGKGPWWEVTIGALTHPSSPYNSLWQVMSSEGSHVLAPLASLTPLSSLGSFMSFSSQQKLMAVTASAKAGVCILEAGNKVHACWNSTTGYHYTPACKDGVFQLTNWINMAANTTALWLVRDDGELYCLTPEEKLLRIDCVSTVTLMAGSPTIFWVVSNDWIWSRQGMDAQVPEGISWEYIELNTSLHESKVRYIACGKKAVWAIDGTGVPYFRFGVHAREPGTGMSPAWVPVDNNPHPLLQIAVSPDDWLVWACDEKYNAYVRTGVTQDFPVGSVWELVPNEQIKHLCAACGKIYALTPSGELLCRYGITERNPQGNYWRRMPGKYTHLTTGPAGELWTLDDKGQIWRQESKVLAVAQQSDVNQAEFELSMVVDPSWEMV